MRTDDDTNTGAKRVEVYRSERGGWGVVGRRQRPWGGPAGEADPARRYAWMAAAQESRRWLMKLQISPRDKVPELVRVFRRTSLSQFLAAPG